MLGWENAFINQSHQNIFIRRYTPFNQVNPISAATQTFNMKFQNAILLSILSLGTLSLAHDDYYRLYSRDAMAEADPYAYAEADPYADADADADAWLEDYAHFLQQREAKKKHDDDSWTPKIIGSYKKDTLKCNKEHVCSGEIIV